MAICLSASTIKPSDGARISGKLFELDYDHIEASIDAGGLKLEFKRAGVTIVTFRPEDDARIVIRTAHGTIVGEIG